MSVSFKDGYFNFNRILENHADLSYPRNSWAKVLLSSSRKDNREEGKRIYSDWIATFRLDAMKDLDTLVKRDFIVCNGAFSREGKEQSDGNKKWFDAQMTVFEWHKHEKNKSAPIDPPENDIPF